MTDLEIMARLVCCAIAAPLLLRRWLTWGPRLPSHVLALVVLALGTWIVAREHGWRSADDGGGGRSRDREDQLVAAGSSRNEGCDASLFALHPALPPPALQYSAYALVRGLVRAGRAPSAQGREHEAIARWLRDRVAVVHSKIPPPSTPPFFASFTDDDLSSTHTLPPSLSSFMDDLFSNGTLPPELAFSLAQIDAHAAVMRDHRHMLATLVEVHVRMGDRGTAAVWHQLAGFVRLMADGLATAEELGPAFEGRVHSALADFELFRRQTMHNAVTAMAFPSTPYDSSARALWGRRTEFLLALVHSAHLTGLVALFAAEIAGTRGALAAAAHWREWMSPDALAQLPEALAGRADVVGAYDVAVHQYLHTALAASSPVGSESAAVRACIAEKCPAWAAWYFMPYVPPVIPR